MAFQTDSSDRLLSEINVTPLVDVMLVLLIIFMVSAPMMTQGVDVTLPQAVSGPLPSKEEQMMVTVKADGRIFLNELETSLALLKDRLREVLANRPERQVFFKADTDISYGLAVQVMSEIRAAGVDNLGMVTAPVEPVQKDEKSSRKRG